MVDAQFFQEVISTNRLVSPPDEFENLTAQIGEPRPPRQAEAFRLGKGGVDTMGMIVTGGFEH